MMAANIAPGMNRSFTAEKWTNFVGRKYWYGAIDEANDLVDDQIETDIQGYDIDGDIIKAARQNAREAGVDHLIHFQQRPLSELSHPKKYGFIVSNPPYGERLEEKSHLPALYTEIGDRFRELDSWSMYLITSYEDAEKYIGKKADKNRKIYNGMLKTYYYQVLGPKPPKMRRLHRRCARKYRSTSSFQTGAARFPTPESRSSFFRRKRRSTRRSKPYATVRRITSPSPST